MKIKTLLILTIQFSLFFHPFSVQAQATKGKAISKSKEAERPAFKLSELALPSEVKNVPKASGAIFYSPSVKGKVLIPVNFWGSVSRPGLHFVPVDSSLIQGLSFAGGPTSSAKTNNVRLSRVVGNETENKVYDLTAGGDPFTSSRLQPGDVIFVEKDTFTENRAYYTSLIGVAISLLSSILIYRQVKKND